MRRIETITMIATAIFAVLAFMAICTAIFSIQGCAKTEVEYRNVLVPTPVQCDFNITHAPEINTGDLQNMLKSLKDLSFDSKKIRREIQQVPCLNINYKDIK